jgi:cytoskeletal protein CcmA (bactofilin family)
MFNKKDEASSADSGPNEPPARRPDMKSKAPSILSADLTVHGSLVSDGEVQLDGNVEGDVRASALTIGEDATVVGEVVAETVTIRGKVKGSVRARQVQLTATARMEGDIIHSTLAVESGAYFDGHCKRSSDPMAGGKSHDKSKSASAPLPFSGGTASPKPVAASGGEPAAAKP